MLRNKFTIYVADKIYYFFKRNEEEIELIHSSFAILILVMGLVFIVFGGNGRILHLISFLLWSYVLYHLIYYICAKIIGKE